MVGQVGLHDRCVAINPGEVAPVLPGYQRRTAHLPGHGDITAFPRVPAAEAEGPGPAALSVAC